MRSSLFIKQTTFRVSAIVMVKGIGLIGRISLTRLIGAEGIGLYQIAYSYYGLALMVITGGLPTALALYTARHPQHSWVWFKNISIYLVLMGGSISMLSFCFSGGISQLLGNPELYFFIRCLAPALFAVPLLSLLRGYLQGMERYNVIAVSELIEQAVRVLFMLALVSLLLPNGSAFAAGNSMLGTLFGALSAFFVLILYFFYYSNQQSSILSTQKYTLFRTDLKWFFHSSFIISLTRLLTPLSDVLDAIIIPGRLQVAGYSTAQATSMFGVLTGMAVLIVYMPSIATAALSHTLTMKLVTDWRERKYDLFNRRTRLALEAGWVWGCSSGLFLYEYNTEISYILFGSAEAAEPIKYLSIIPLLVGLREISTSILWAQDRKKAPLLGLFCGIGIAVTLHYFLVAIPGLNYMGALVGILVLELIAVGWNLKSLLPVLKKINYSKLLADSVIVIGAMVIVLLVSRAHVLRGFSENIRALIGMALYGGMIISYIYFRFIAKGGAHKS